MSSMPNMLVRMQGKPRQAVRYFLKALALVACLMVIGMVAPYLPSVFIPIILVAFSLLSTCGALYYTVVNRLHKQYKLNAGGQLSYINRRWTWRLVGFLVLFLFSGFFFLLEAPKWDALEWVLTWLAIPVYYFVFLFAQQYLKKEFAPAFYKSNAMKWSFWIVGVLLCLIYAVLSLLLPSVEYATLADAFHQTVKPYAASPSALMNEVDKLASLADGITAFGIAQVADISYPLAFVCKFAIYASVFFGLVNQFGFCLLDADEIRSEFRTLPAQDEDVSRSRGAFVDGQRDAEAEGQPTDASPGRIRRQYIIAVVVVFVVALAGYLTLEFEVAEAQATQEHTAIEGFVNDQMDALVFIVDGAYTQTKEWAENRDSYAQQIADLRTERNDALMPLIDEYYTHCEENIDSYLDWYYGAAGAWAKFLKPFGNLAGDDAVKTFKERITRDANTDTLQEEYASYRERIDRLVKDASLLDLQDSLSQQLQVADTDEGDSGENEQAALILDLWQPLSDWRSSSIVEDTLLNTDVNLSRDEMREKLRELIEDAHADTIAKLESDIPTLVVSN